MSSSNLPAISSRELNDLTKLINDLCGISLSCEKEYLIRQRFAGLLKANSIAGFAQLIEKLRNSPELKLKDQIINSIVTSETSFFRDQKPFDLLYQKIFPRFFEEQQLRPVNILSAGVSTGEEIYSLSVLIHEFCSSLPQPTDPVGQFSLTGIDISQDVLSKAKSGEFSSSQVSKGLRKDYLDRYFKQSSDLWIAKNSIKQIITFRRYDLTSTVSLGIPGTFDIIFCRNVLIYFDDSNKNKALERFYELLSSRGILILGSSEIINSSHSSLFKSTNQNGCLMYTKNQRS